MNNLALNLVKRFEGCRLVGYLDTLASPPVPTIGYGATGPGIFVGTVWTQEQADADLAKRLDALESGIRRSLLQQHGPVLTTEQMAALQSLAYNIGLAGLFSSNLYHSVLNGDFVSAARAFIQWDHAGGKEVKGLLIRRLLEATLFLEGS